MRTKLKFKVRIRKALPAVRPAARLLAKISMVRICFAATPCAGKIPGVVKASW